MMKEYFWKNKHHYFPHIKDWTNPQDQWRYEKDVSKLNFWQWFFCHPSAYKLMHYGVPIIGLTSFCATGILFYIKGHPIIAIILTIIGLLNIRVFKHRYAQRIYINTTKITFYDLWMREEKLNNP